MARIFKSVAESGAMLLVWVGLLVLFGACSENFLSAATLTTLANSIPTLTVVASGMTLVLLIGGIDLSVGSVLGFCGSVLGMAMVNWHWSFAAASLLCAGAGMLAGWMNGLISVRFGIPSFIVTLGMLEIARGLAYLTTHSQTQYIGSRVEALAANWTFGISPAFILAMLIVIAAQIVLSKTIFGRLLIAIGTNEQAVRLAGINPRPAKVAAFCIIGFLTGVGALFYTSRLGSADPNAGAGLELSAIAAVVIGGTSLLGGRGSVINSFFGVLIIATLQAGLAQVGATEPIKRVVTGGVIIAAVILDAWRHRLARAKLGRFGRLFARP
jgi:ribose transport system permease protein